MSFSKMNASRGPQNKAHCRLTCPWEPATQQSESNNHLNPPGTPLLLEYTYTMLLALSVPTDDFFPQSVILGIFPFALRSLTCLKESFYFHSSSYYLHSTSPLLSPDPSGGNHFNILKSPMLSVVALDLYVVILSCSFLI